MADLTRVQPTDVLCNGDIPLDGHEGNILYADIVADRVESRRGLNPPTPHGRLALSRLIIQAIHVRGGRFLGRTDANTWMELPMQYAIAWISCQLRYMESVALDRVFESNDDDDAPLDIGALLLEYNMQILEDEVVMTQGNQREVRWEGLLLDEEVLALLDE